jgi:hypothetical protein
VQLEATNKLQTSYKGVRTVPHVRRERPTGLDHAAIICELQLSREVDVLVCG